MSRVGGSVAMAVAAVAVAVAVAIEGCPPKKREKGLPSLALPVCAHALPHCCCCYREGGTVAAQINPDRVHLKNWSVAAHINPDQG